MFPWNDRVLGEVLFCLFLCYFWFQREIVSPTFGRTLRESRVCVCVCVWGGGAQISLCICPKVFVHVCAGVFTGILFPWIIFTWVCIMIYIFTYFCIFRYHEKAIFQDVFWRGGWCVKITLFLSYFVGRHKEGFLCTITPGNNTPFLPTLEYWSYSNVNPRKNGSLP